MLDKVAFLLKILVGAVFVSVVLQDMHSMLAFFITCLSKFDFILYC